MVDYTIRAYPTRYRGRLYRSRLEARWAAFFWLVGLDVEYEPADLGSWSPDLLVSYHDGYTMLAEIKPITEFDYDVARKMTRSAWEAKYDGDLLLLGTCPKGLRVGWVFQETYPHNPSHTEFKPLSTFLVDGAQRTEAFWADACNQVQWSPQR